jgi:predicted RecB family nuclease
VRWRRSEVVSRLLEDEAEVGKLARASRRGRVDLTVRVDGKTYRVLDAVRSPSPAATRRFRSSVAS